MDSGIDDGDQKQIQRRLREYAGIGSRLFKQRIVIYTAASGLAGSYYDWTVALIFYAFVLICEIYDAIVFREILNRNNWKPTDINSSMLKIYMGTILSSFAVSSFAIAFAILQGSEIGHFMPMFMLVSASIFAAINNHQFVPVLALRLAIYVSAILFIPIYDIWKTSAPLSSEVWLHFFTVIFVLGFLLELARTFLNGYARVQRSRLRLEEEHERTKAAYIAKDQFLSTVSHELRTPLTSIKGALTLINSGGMGDLPDKVRVPLEIADRNSHRLADLVNDLLLLQQADGGKLALKLSVVDFGELVNETTDRFRPYAASAKVNIQIDISEGEFWVLCDVKRMEQVVTNLLSNAAKFSSKRGEISVSMEKLDGVVRLSISDTGIGIPAGANDKIFEQFVQLDSSDTRTFQGTGLGLNISKRIVEAHKARIYYTSVLGRGSTFYVELQENKSISNGG